MARHRAHPFDRPAPEERPTGPTGRPTAAERREAREYIDTAKDKKKNSHAIYAQAIEAPFRGSLVVSHSVKKAAPKLPFGFMCYSDDGQAMHLSADGPEDMGAWMSAMELQKEGGAMMDKWDTNRDGVLDSGEWQAFEASLPEITPDPSGRSQKLKFRG